MVLAALLLVIAQGGGADPKAEIQKQYDLWSKAYMDRDGEVLIGILSPDYKLINGKKETTGYDVYAAKLRLLKDAPSDRTKYSTKIKKLSLRGDEADVIAIETMESATTDPKSGKSAVSYHRHEYLDTWIHYDAGWRLRRTVTQRESTEVRVVEKH